MLLVVVIELIDFCGEQNLLYALSITIPFFMTVMIASSLEIFSRSSTLVVDFFINFIQPFTKCNSNARSSARKYGS